MNAPMHSWFGFENWRCCSVEMSWVCHGLLGICEFFRVGAFLKSKCWDGTGVKALSSHMCTLVRLESTHTKSKSACCTVLVCSSAAPQDRCLSWLALNPDPANLRINFSGPGETNLSGVTLYSLKLDATDLLWFSCSYHMNSDLRCPLNLLVEHILCLWCLVEN